MSGFGALSWIETFPGFEAQPGFNILIDQEQPVLHLSTILKKRTIPHALLFTGIEGIGKLTAALIFAMACNCTAIAPGETVPGERRCQNNGFQAEASEPCGKCKVCKKIISGNHPDIILIKPTGNLIKIDQIRSLCRTLALKPYEARTRVVLISDAHVMNKEAGNALLKVLEEPPDQTVLILTAGKLSDLLPTIVSRCQHIRFNPIAGKCLEQYLTENYKLQAEEAIAVASMANGSLEKAMALTDGSGANSNWTEMRKWIIHEIETLPEMPVNMVLAFAEKLSKNKDILSDALDVMKLYFRDLVICRYCSAKVINRDLIEKLEQDTGKFSLKKLLFQVEAVELFQQHMATNMNLRLSLEVMLLKLASV